MSDPEHIFNSFAPKSATSVDEEPVITMDIYDTSNWGNLDNKAWDIFFFAGTYYWTRGLKGKEKVLNILWMKIYDIFCVAITREK